MGVVSANSGVDVIRKTAKSRVQVPKTVPAVRMDNNRSRRSGSVRKGTTTMLRAVKTGMPDES